MLEETHEGQLRLYLGTRGDVGQSNSEDLGRLLLHQTSSASLMTRLVKFVAGFLSRLDRSADNFIRANATLEARHGDFKRQRELVNALSDALRLVLEDLGDGELCCIMDNLCSD
jgi:hypothetical protein